MNILRTIQKDETPEWVDLFFEEGPHEGENVPGYPPGFAFPFKLQQCAEGEFLYLVYGSQVIGYGRIAGMKRHDSAEVGTEEQLVGSGYTVELDGPLQRMPFDLSCRGFVGVRYTSENLHQLDQATAEQEINALKLAVS